VSVIVALVAVLLRLLHGLVIVFLLAGGGGFGGRDRGRLFAARVHPEQAKRARKEKSGKINKLDTAVKEMSEGSRLTRPFAIASLVISPSGRFSSDTGKKNTADKLLFYADAGRKHVAANTREFP